MFNLLLLSSAMISMDSFGFSHEDFPEIILLRVILLFFSISSFFRHFFSKKMHTKETEEKKRKTIKGEKNFYGFSE